MTSSERDEFLKWLADHEGRPYLWGGRGWRSTNPPPPEPGPLTGVDGMYPSPYEGWDCWGLVSDGLLACGGPDLRLWWTDRAWEKLQIVSTPQPGDLAFWAPLHPTGPSDVEHVEVVVGDGTPLSLAGGAQIIGWRTIGARGGNHLTVTLAVAKDLGACVKYRRNHLERARFAGFRCLP
jgi:hypothetical protein